MNMLMNLRDTLQISSAADVSLSSPEGGEGRGEEGRVYCIPLSLALSPLLRRGAREFTALCRVYRNLIIGKSIAESASLLVMSVKPMRWSLDIFELGGEIDLPSFVGNFVGTLGNSTKPQGASTKFPTRRCARPAECPSSRCRQDAGSTLESLNPETCCKQVKF
jgi:hypothetical protein